MRRHLPAILTVLFCVTFGGYAVWGSGTANNPGCQVCVQTQGPDPTGNAGYPMSVVNATNTSLDAAQSGAWSVGVNNFPATQPVSGTVTANQGTSPWIIGFGGTTQPVNIQANGGPVDGQSNASVMSTKNGLVTCSVPFLKDKVDGHFYAATLDDNPISDTLDWSSANSQDVSAQQRAVTNGSGNSVLVRTPAIFKPQSAVSIASEATIWTPAGGKKFRLMGYHLACSVSGNVILRDNTAGTIIDVIPETAGVPVVVDLHNGILSAAANNVLTATGPALSTLSGEVDGTEE